MHSRLFLLALTARATVLTCNGKSTRRDLCRAVLEGTDVLGGSAATERPSGDRPPRRRAGITAGAPGCAAISQAAFGFFHGNLQSKEADGAQVALAPTTEASRSAAAGPSTRQGARPIASAARDCLHLLAYGSSVAT